MSKTSIHNAPSSEHETEIVAALVTKARNAMEDFYLADQARVDEAVTALAWAIYEPDRARELAERAVADTGLGNMNSKIIKNQRKTFGCLRDLMRVKTVGVIEEIKTKGLYKYAKPVGVVAAIAPSTNPAATPVNKAMMALKGRNAVIVAPSPAGASTTTQTVEYMRAELIKIGLPADLVQEVQAALKQVAQPQSAYGTTANTGASRDDIMQAFLHVAVYAGVPKANHAIKLAKQTFAEMEEATDD